MSKEVNYDQQFRQLNRMAAIEANLSGKEQDKAAAEPARTPLPEALPEYDTATLFAGGREIIIRHADAAYRMKITKQGKLILNK
jgi:hemin uptake protein HemP